MITHKGTCHCKRVRFEVEASSTINACQCNCSICSMSGHLGMVVPRDRFRLISGEDCLGEYNFGTGKAKHLFCKHCGIKSFYIPRSHPDSVSVHINCLDHSTIEKINIFQFDGQHWEQSFAEGQIGAHPN